MCERRGDKHAVRERNERGDQSDLLFMRCRWCASPLYDGSSKQPMVWLTVEERATVIHCECGGRGDRERFGVLSDRLRPNRAQRVLASAADL